MTIETHKTFCRICTAYCAIEVDVADGRVQAVRGDASDPLTGGYTCIKGRQLGYQQGGPTRLRVISNDDTRDSAKPCPSGPTSTNRHPL